MNTIKRDIQWLVKSPSLIAPDWEGVTIINDMENWVQQMGGFLSSGRGQKSIDDMEPELAQSIRRLGVYAEWLFQLWIGHLSPFELLDRGVQVRDRETGQTLGELDFLLKLADRYIHVEMAVKYYLATENGSRLAMYYGPNPRDRMDKKWQKMVEQQSQWLQADNAHLRYDLNTDLPETTLRQNWENHILMKGMIFKQWNPKISDQQWPPEVNPQCDQGWWCFNKDWSHFLQNQPDNLRWMALPKLRWLSAALEESESHLRTTDQAIKQIDASRNPQMVAGLTQQREGHWLETQRIVIVPNQWPH
jgi:hypothetical protein